MILICICCSQMQTCQCKKVNQSFFFSTHCRTPKKHSPSSSKVCLSSICTIPKYLPFLFFNFSMQCLLLKGGDTSPTKRPSHDILPSKPVAHLTGETSIFVTFVHIMFTLVPKKEINHSTNTQIGFKVF